MNAVAAPPKGNNETDVSAQQSKTQTHARVPGPDGHGRWARGAQTAARQGSETAHRIGASEAATVADRARGERFPKRNRIRKRGEFLHLQRVGSRKAGTCFVVITRPRTDRVSRLGITTSRKVGDAVHRNRVRRMVREFFRRRKAEIVPARDVLVIARPAATAATYATVKYELALALGLPAVI